MPSEVFNKLADETKNSLIEALIDHYAEFPATAPSLGYLAQRSGLQATDLEQVFPNKEDFFVPVQEALHTAKLQMVSNMTQPASSLDTFAYLRWTVQVAVLFELKHPKLAKIERDHRAPYLPHMQLPTEEDPIEESNQYKDLMVQGVMHDDIAAWVDVDMATFLLTTVISECAPYLVERMGNKVDSLRDGSVDIVYDPYVQDLFDSFMDLFEAGMARDPQIRKDYYSK
ncbi:MAG TPA: hypothetical protein VLR89_09925 [Anaerolineaceae bacterium]|nr:hypothetical protein [Anaerolineaceae bacterium]